jgi:hypothetical protein
MRSLNDETGEGLATVKRPCRSMFDLAAGAAVLPALSSIALAQVYAFSRIECERWGPLSHRSRPDAPADCLDRVPIFDWLDPFVSRSQRQAGRVDRETIPALTQDELFATVNWLTFPDRSRNYPA